MSSQATLPAPWVDVERVSGVPISPCQFNHGDGITDEVSIAWELDGEGIPYYFGECMGCGGRGPISDTPEMALARWNGEPVTAESCLETDAWRAD